MIWREEGNPGGARFPARGGLPPPALAALLLGSGMSLLDRIERRLGRWAIPNLSLYIVIGQVFVLLGELLGRFDRALFLLVPLWVVQGDYWRVLSFVLVPPPPGLFGYLFVAFAWYLFYLMGSALEGHWGAFRYNLFLLAGLVLTVAASFLTPLAPATNAFIAGTVFLAFAHLNPNFELSLFFLLPIRIKWLALVTWVLYGVEFFRGGLATKFQVVASVGNFLLFFGADIVRSLRSRQRRRAHEAARAVEAEAPRHVCHVCGKTDRSHPDLDFRYCSKCAGDQCYCPEHIHQHAHVAPSDEARSD